MFGYLIIFLAKIVEVSLGTIRIVFITKGQKVLGSIIGFFEVSIWLMVISNVLINIKDDPFKMVVYALGFAMGNYIGTTIEDKLALGLITVQIIVSKNDGECLASALRENQMGATVVEGKGKEEERDIIYTHIKRKRKGELIELVKNNKCNAVISINETKTIYGGYGLRK